LQSGEKLNETTGEFRVGENHKKPHDKISGNKKTTTQISRIEPNSILLQTAMEDYCCDQGQPTPLNLLSIRLTKFI
jgi:hypothetical protein